MSDELLNIRTPEGIEFELPIAGVGSRGIAILLDTLIQGLAFIALSIGISALPEGDSSGTGIVGGILIFVAAFFIMFFYHVVFEVWVGGATPGKRSMHLRVVDMNGESVGVLSSCTRNLIRILDFLPGAYGVGILAMVISTKSQRVGDFAARTLVIHDFERVSKRDVKKISQFNATSEVLAQTNWDVSAITSQDLAIIRSFLDRRPFLDHAARVKLSVELAQRFEKKVTSPGRGNDAEEFLQQIVVTKDGR